MAHIVILGAGVGGMTMAYEMRESARAEDKVTVISNLPYFQFTPSNPWVAVNWRKRDDITIPAAPYLNKKNIDFIAVGAARVHPEKNQVELTDGQVVDYDFLIIATGPKLAFDEVPGLGPEGHTQSICTVDHAVNSGRVWDDFVKAPGPIVVGAVQGASCYGPAYEFAMIMDTDLRKRKIRDKVRAPMPSQATGEEAFSAVREVINKLLPENLGHGPRFYIGVSCPGPLNPKRGVIINPPNLPCWRDFPLAQRISETWSLPAVIDNDSNSAAHVSTRL